MATSFRARARTPFGWLLQIVGWCLLAAKTVADWIGRSTIFDDAALLETRSGRMIAALQSHQSLWFYVAVFALLCAGVFLIVPAGKLPWLFRLKKVAGKTFRNQDVLLDGHHYDACKFDHVTFVFNGGKFSLTNSEIGSHLIRSDLPAINGMALLLYQFDHLKIPVHNEAGQIERTNNYDRP